MAFDKSGVKAVWAAWLGNTPKRCELQLFLAGIGQGWRRWTAHDLGRFNMQFQQDWPKDKKLKLFKFFGWKLRKISLNWAQWCASRGIDNFSSSQLLEYYRVGNCQLAQLKYAFFSKTGRKTKKLRRSKLFLLTVLKHELLERSTNLLHYRAINGTFWKALH